MRLGFMQKMFVGWIAMGLMAGLPRFSLAQEADKPARDNSNTTEAQGAAKPKQGSKQAVEARLKAAEKPKPLSAIHEVEKTLFTTKQFQQVAISPDGQRLAWVETLIGKDGAPTGNTAIYVSNLQA
ncbi:MAG TPA: hypothetical protein VIM00_13370, partial [Candidatus Acidoferrum sp.]